MKKKTPPKNIPTFEFSGDVITISGRSMMEDPVDEWGKFITNIRIYINGRRQLTVNFILDGISSNNSLYLTNLFFVFNEHRYKCKIVVNWYYWEADEAMQFLGEYYQKRNPKLKINLYKRNV